MAAASMKSGGSGGGEDRVMATAQQIVQSLNAGKDVREDMLLIFSSFDNRLSNISDLMTKKSGAGGGCDAEHDEEYAAVWASFELAEGVILRWDSNSKSSSRSSSSNYRHQSSSCSSVPLSFEDSRSEAEELLSAVDDIIQLLDDDCLADRPELRERAESALQLAMAQLEDEFRYILIRNTVLLDADRLYGSIRRVSSSELEIGELENFGELTESESARSLYHDRGLSLGGDLWVDLIKPDAVIDLREIADRMIRARYEKECIQAYCTVRREALEECLMILGAEKLSIEEVQKIEWKTLDEMMKKWIQAVKITVRVLLSGEKRLCEDIFQCSESIEEVCFNETAKGCLIQLLNFGEAVAIGKRSSEKLFRILDMYEAMAAVFPDLESMVTDEFVQSEAKGVLVGLGDAARGTFMEFERDVQSETSKKPTLNCEIHPMTRYIMNYMKLLVDYSDTLNSLLEDADEDGEDDDDNGAAPEEEIVSTFGNRLLKLISVLESNLEVKSKLYEDLSMQYVFLMNNILYIVQRVKDSKLRSLFGDDWVRKRSGQVRQYATSYLRASWTRALLCLKDEGIVGSSGGGLSRLSSSNASKMALKEKFKNFNACFEDIYRIQTAWKVPDAQLREELRISISEKVIPAYRSFFGRNKGQLENGRHAGKYIKYSPDDLENYLLDFFEGSQNVVHHPRR